ncbi:MAG: hypothetical protein JO002_17305 [Burkholderiaceae bacterium]|nr:hypothetical protein [Burkholderiaceae bacterium]
MGILMPAVALYFEGRFWGRGAPGDQKNCLSSLCTGLQYESHGLRQETFKPVNFFEVDGFFILNQ